MNELQKKELELLKCFIEICEKLRLRYFLVCGSVLGAVKYGGFIPWDDDIDVGLFREDYRVFLQNAPGMLPEHFFLQTFETDPAFPAIFSKLRNSSTTFIERSALGLPINQGIAIDIFPLDGYPEEPARQRWLEWRKMIYRRLLSAAYLPDRKWKWLFVGPLRILGVHRHSGAIARRYEALITRYPAKGSKIIANHGNWQGKLEYAPAAQYGEGLWGEFEGIPVRLPAQFDGYLSRKYGEYQQDPPVAARKSHHDAAVIDCGNPYMIYTGR